MEAAIPNFRKRSRRSSPLTGTLTRSRFRQLLHRNRSGQTRCDPFRRPEKPDTEVGAKQESSDLEDTILIRDICKKAKRNNGEISRRLAKDIRARRVYSPQSSAGASPNLIESVLPSIEADSDEKLADLGLGSPSSAATSDICVEGVTLSGRFEMAENLDLELSLDPWKFNRGNTDSSEPIVKLQDIMQNDGDDSQKIDDLVEEPVITTPPDDVISGDSKVERDVGNMEADLRVKYTRFVGNAEENSGEGFPGKDCQRSGSVRRSKSVMRPRLPGKLFKAPGSVSYRRLFPFLLDIMGDNSGDHCHEDEKGVDGQDFQLPLSPQSHEASQHEVKTESCTNESNLSSSPMEVDVKEVAGECLSMPSVDDICASESKADPTADLHGAKNVVNALHNDDFNQFSIHVNNLDCAKATNIAGCTSERLDVLNGDCTSKTPDVERYDNSVISVDQLQSMPQDVCYVKPMDLTISTKENAIEGLYLKADKRSDSLRKSKYVSAPHLRGKLFKTPGSVSFKRMLPFFMDLNNDGSGTSNFGDQTHNKKDEKSSKGFQLTLPSQGEEAHINGQITAVVHVHDMVESDALENIILVNPANGLSHCSLPKFTSSQDITELPKQLKAKEVVHECLPRSPVKEHFEKVVTGFKGECASDLEFDPSSTKEGLHCAEIASNAVLGDGSDQIQNMTSIQHYSESPTKDQSMLFINDVSNLACENHSSQEKEVTIDYDDGKQLVNLEKCESVIRCPPEVQSLSQLDPNMLDVEENKTSSHAICKNDAIVLNHASVSSEEPRSPPSEKTISEKQARSAHGGEAGSVLKDIVYSPRMPSKQRSKTNASFAVENQNESNTASVLNRCQRIKTLKHAGSFNYKRLLPFFLNTTKYKSRASINAHNPKPRKPLDQPPHWLVSDSNLRVTPVSDSNDCVPKDHSTSIYGAQKVPRLRACDLNNDSSSQGVRFPPKTHGCQSLSHLKVREQLKVPAVGFQKGILKRSPRGCRGLCTCLNCVSFHLHAERAFEFSRNQLLDAEEIAQDLMKELSHLRNMLERYTDSDINNPVFDGSQVQEACSKAFETEQHANHRLSEMNDDLNIHCRIPRLERPKVKFSDQVEEKFFQSGR